MFQRGGRAWPKQSMTTQVETHWRCARRSLDPRGSMRNGRLPSFSQTRAVAHPWAHVVPLGWTCMAQALNDHATRDTMAVLKTFIGPARKHWGWPRSISFALAGYRKLVGARRGSGVYWYGPSVQEPRSWEHNGRVHDVHCTRANPMGVATVDLSCARGWSPPRVPHLVAAGWTCMSQAFNNHAIRDTMGVCKTFIGPARKHWGWPSSVSFAIARGRQPVGARRCSGVELYRRSIQ